MTERVEAGIDPLRKDRAPAGLNVINLAMNAGMQVQCVDGRRQHWRIIGPTGLRFDLWATTGRWYCFNQKRGGWGHSLAVELSI